MKILLFSFVLAIHAVGLCDYSVKCNFLTHETIYTATGEIFRKSEVPYVIGIDNPILTVGAQALRLESPYDANRFYTADKCKSQPPLLGYDCYAIKNYFQGIVPAVYLSKNDRETMILKAPVGNGLLGETRFTDVDYYSCPN